MLYSQNKLSIDGQLSLETGTISGATVKLEKNGRSAGTVNVSSSGSFDLDLDLNAEYIVTITQSGYITRKIKILTNVPAEAVSDGLNAEALPIYLTKTYPGGPDGSKIDATLKFNQALYAFEFDKSEFASIALQKKKLDPEKSKAIAAEEAQKAEEAKAKAAQMAKLQAEYEEQVRKAEEEERRKKEEAALNAKYNEAITKAEKALADKNYEFAKTSYQEAAKLKPNEPVPPAKIKEIDNLVANENKYKAEIEKADKAFAAGDFAGAKTAYNAAAALKPTEQYPKQKIKECDDAIAAANKEKEAKAKFDAAIAKGDKSMSSKDYVGAKNAYNEALGVKPGDPTATQKLQDAEAKIKEEEAKKQQEKEINDKYAAAMSKGDNAFKSKNYADAKEAYKEAAGLKPNETAPKTKIAEVEAAEKAEADKIAKEKELNAKYEALIVEADRKFGETKLEEAKKQYTEALKLKAGEAYPTSQIAKIDKLIAEENAAKAKEAELQNKYTAALSKGETALKAGKLSDAKAAYQEAANLKPTEELPKTKLSEIEVLIAAEAEKKAKEAEIQKEYDQVMASAKNDLAAKNYEAAIQGFDKAATLKPNEAEPKLKKKEAEDGLKNQQALAAKEKEIQAKYEAAMAKGEQLFAAKDYNAAKAAFTEAKTAKPNETAPQAKISEIDNILKAEADKVAAEKAAKEAEEKARKEAEAKAEAERLAAEKAAKEAAAKEEAERLAAEKAAKEAAAKEEAERLAAEKAAKEAAAKEEAERLAAEKAKAEAEEKARKEAEAKAEAERLAAEKAAKEAAAKEEAERLAAEKAKAEAEEKARKEAELKAQQEQQRLAELEAEKAKKAAAEEEARKKAEQEAARLAAEQEAARKKAEEEARRLAEEDAKRQAEIAAAEAKRKAEEDAKRKQQSAEAQKKFAEEEAKRAEEAAKRRKEALALAKMKSKPVQQPPKKYIYLFPFISGTPSAYGVVNMNDGSGNRIVSESEFKSLQIKYKDKIWRD